MKTRKMKELCAIVLAAGKGTRMGTGAPKVLREILQKPLIYWALSTLKELEIKDPIVVTGYQADIVEKKIKELGFKVKFTRQTKQLGTAHSVKVGLKKLPETCKQVLILFGDDAALYKSSTLKSFIDYHIQNKNYATLLSLKSKENLDLGGLERDYDGNVVGVLSKQQLQDRKNEDVELVCGAFCFKKQWIDQILPQIKKNPISGEYPLPKVITIAKEKREFVSVYHLENADEWNSVNTVDELKQAEEKKGRLIN